MKLSARPQVLGLVLVALIGCAVGAPLPSPSPSPSPSPKVSPEENLVEAYEDGLLLFVPTIPAVDKKKSGQELKREVEYELIAIPGEVLRREIRQIAQQYGAPSVGGGGGGGPFLVTEVDDDILDFGEIIIPGPAPAPAPSSLYGPPGGGSTSGGSLPSITLPSKPGVSLPTITVSNKPDFGSVIASVAGGATNYVSGAGQTLANVGAAGTQVLGQVGTAAASGGAQLASWAFNQKSQGLRTASQIVGNGLQFAGQLSASVLRALLQVPGIKARVLAEIIQAGQPLVYAVSDVIAESADDLGDIFEAKASILQEALGIIIRLIQDTLSLKGRIIYTLGSSGLDIGATAFNAGVRIGGAFVDTATKVASAVGGGVGDIVNVAQSVDLPRIPTLPPISIPQLPNIQVPQINIPQVDLSGLVPAKPALPPLPLPTVSVSNPTVTVVQSSGPSQVYGSPAPSAPSQLYGPPAGR